MSEVNLEKYLTSAEIVSTALQNPVFQITLWEGRKCSIRTKDKDITVAFKVVVQFLEKHPELVTQAAKQALIGLNRITDEEIFKQQSTSTCKKIILIFLLFLVRLFKNCACGRIDYKTRILNLGWRGSSELIVEPSNRSDATVVTEPDDLPVQSVPPQPEPPIEIDPEAPDTPYDLYRKEQQRHKNYLARQEYLEFLNDHANRQNPEMIILYFNTRYLVDLFKFPVGISLRDLNHWLAGQKKEFIEQLAKKIEDLVDNSTDRYEVFYRLHNWIETAEKNLWKINPLFESRMKTLIAAKVNDIDFMVNLLIQLPSAVEKGNCLGFLRPERDVKLLKAVLQGFITKIQNTEQRISELLLCLTIYSPKHLAMEIVSTILEIKNQTWQQFRDECGGQQQGAFHVFFSASFWTYCILTEIRSNRSQVGTTAITLDDHPRTFEELWVAGEPLGKICTSDECSLIMTAIELAMKGSDALPEFPFVAFVTSILQTKEQDKIKNTFERVWSCVANIAIANPPPFWIDQQCFRSVPDLQSLETVIETLPADKSIDKYGTISACVAALFKATTTTQTLDESTGHAPLKTTNTTYRPMIPLAERIELMSFRPDLCQRVERFTPVKNLFQRSLGMGEETAKQNLKKVYHALRSGGLHLPPLVAIILSYMVPFKVQVLTQEITQ